MSFDILTTLQNWPTWAIVTVLLLVMSAANEVGFRRGRRYDRNESDLSNSASSSLKGTIFGLVALLLGFSFSATTSRHEFRQRLVLDQANAVGTCFLRAGLLPEPSRSRLRDVLRGYVRTRLDLYEVGAEQSDYVRASAEIDGQMAALWEAVEAARERDAESIRISMIVPAANEVIDLSSTRAWAVRNRLPQSVLFLLLTCVVVSCLLLGHSSGQAGIRHVGLWLAANIVFSLVLFVVLDFDRPRRGLIRVDHTPLVELQKTLGEAIPSGDSHPSDGSKRNPSKD